MVRTHIINIDSDTLPDYQLGGRNIGTVRVLDSSGKEIDAEVTVMIELSKEGLLGFGTELIRYAYDFVDGAHNHISPVIKDLICQSMGIYLTPNSRELIVLSYTETNLIKDYLK